MIVEYYYWLLLNGKRDKKWDRNREKGHKGTHRPNQTNLYKEEEGTRTLRHYFSNHFPNSKEFNPGFRREGWDNFFYV